LILKTGRDRPISLHLHQRSALDFFCGQQISRYKRPKAYRFTEELPKNACGKALKRELRKRLDSGQA
jgi:long-chain acyl-CoA synthetase